MRTAYSPPTVDYHRSRYSVEILEEDDLGLMLEEEVPELRDYIADGILQENVNVLSAMYSEVS